MNIRTVHEAAIELQKPDLECELAYVARNWEQTRERLQLAQRSYYEPVDKAIFKGAPAGR